MLISVSYYVFHPIKVVDTNPKKWEWIEGIKFAGSIQGKLTIC